MLKVKVQKLNEEAKLPVKAHDSDFCYDVYATSCEEVEPGVWKYGLGLAFEIERPLISWTVTTVGTMFGWSSKELDNYLSDSKCLKLALDFRPRSSIWKTGLILSNCEGTIDELYRGEVLAYFYEVIPGKEKYKVGDRIGQIKLGVTIPLEFVEGEVNMNTDRGTGGFGSTGLK